MSGFHHAHLPGGFEGFNLNMGCPSPDVIKAGLGCASIKRVNKTKQLVEVRPTTVTPPHSTARYSKTLGTPSPSSCVLALTSTKPHTKHILTSSTKSTPISLWYMRETGSKNIANLPIFQSTMTAWRQGRPLLPTAIFQRSNKSNILERLEFEA